MRTVELEALAMRIVEDLKAGIMPEDVRVELKADWPADSNRCARRIAGHCNASRGEAVIWLVGLHEQRGVSPLSSSDTATWWARVRAEFEGEAPPMRGLVVRTADGVLVALHFETDRAPFVVKNARFGEPSGGSVSLEVPWREGTAVSSATRAQLLRLLLPAHARPVLSAQKATLRLDADTLAICGSSTGLEAPSSGWNRAIGFRVECGAG